MNEPYLYKISQIQPSQFYINEKKLQNYKKWIKNIENIFIPVIINKNNCISLDGHTRIKAAIDLGYDSVYIYPDEYDKNIFYFVDEAINRKIYSVYDMEIITDEDYKLKWDKFCDNLFNSIS